MERTSGGVSTRRAIALANLEITLKKGVKPLNWKKAQAAGLSLEEYKKETPLQPLSESDVTRINKEINALKGAKKKRVRKNDKVVVNP